MAVLLSTSLGDIVVDLHTDLCPLTTKNFLKLCKIKYYNNCLFHLVQKDFIAQTGDPTGKGACGDSIYKFLYGEQARFFNDEIHPNLKHSKFGTVAMASAGENLNASQFYFTLRDDLDYLDGKHTMFGEVAEGLDTLARINEAYIDEKGRPYKNIRIKHTYILDDPFDDPPQLAELIPENSPERILPEEGLEVRLEDDWIPMDEQQDPEELEKSLRKKEAESRAVVLEMIGDIPEAEIRPPENVLFVCKLNPVTQEEDLEIIFSRFGKIISADIIRDYKTGDSLCYAFIEFETQEACEAAYFKMDNVLIDDRRIHVDFSQSVAKLWTQYRRASKKNPSDEGVLQGKQRGCFKCGEPGHIAKDCPEDSKETPVPTDPHKPRYILKDTNRQHGDTGKSYEMVFEEDVPAPNKRKLQHDHYKKGTDKSQKGGDSETEQGSKERGRPEHYHTDRKERINQRLREEREDKISEKERDRERYRQEKERDRYKAGTAGPRYSEDGKGNRYKEDGSGIRNRYDKQRDINKYMEDKESDRHRECRGKDRGKEEWEVENHRENREKQGHRGKREMEIHRDDRERENYRDDTEKKRQKEEHDRDKDKKDGRRDRQKEDRAKDRYREERGSEWSKEDRAKGRHRR